MAYILLNVIHPTRIWIAEYLLWWTKIPYQGAAKFLQFADAQNGMAGEVL